MNQPLADKARLQKTILSFLAISFIFSWTTWLLIILLGISVPLKDALITFGVVGPALAAWLVNRPTPAISPRRLRIAVLILVLLTITFYLRSARSVITGNNYNLDELLASPPTIAVIIINLVLASALFIVSRATTFIPRISWIIAALGFFPLIMLLVNGLASILHLKTGYSYSGVPTGDLVLSALIAFPLVFFINGGLEEIGWRGVMQDRLQLLCNPLLAALLTGVAWATWHLVLHVMGFYGGGFQLGTLASRLFINICLSVIIAWFYNRSGGSVIVAMILHTMSNLSVMLFPQQGLLWVVLLFIAAVFFILYGRMWKKATIPARIAG
ncbi:MAG: CPBP family intramembrane metalloprotease [Chitinophagaceae bacterium]|nr:MAG: CPBP family intramembrane metalloprotease [Chitinophagaceae bacterium]